MQRVRIYGGATAGVALVATALSLAACSSSSSSGSAIVEQQSLIRRRQHRQALRHAQRERIDVPARLPAGGHPGFKSIQPGLTVNYGGGGSGKGRTDLASGIVNYAGSDSPIPAKEQANFKGKTVLYFPDVIAPDHGLVQPVRRQQA